VDAQNWLALVAQVREARIAKRQGELIFVPGIEGMAAFAAGRIGGVRLPLADGNCRMEF
jgi:hypothetical protein